MKDVKRERLVCFTVVLDFIGGDCDCEGISLDRSIYFRTEKETLTDVEKWKVFQEDAKLQGWASDVYDRDSKEGMTLEEYRTYLTHQRRTDVTFQVETVEVREVSL